MNARNEACKVSANSIGLPFSCSKKFQKRNGFKFCWAKNFIIYLRRTEDSRPIQIKCHNDLVNFANQEGLPMS